MRERTKRSSRHGLSDREILQQIRTARKRTLAEASTEPRATAARYDRKRGLIVVELKNGTFFGFPAHFGQGLAGATPRDLANVEISPSGEALHWPTLDVDLRVPALLHGMFGTRTWMRELARIGGQSRTTAKTRASRLNGALGGRPRKSGNG